MYIIRKFFFPFILLAFLTACQTKEERAETYYQSALVLLDSGDVERALVELRNVFDNNGRHKEARRLYADLVLERGEVQEAYGQYLRLVEQYPDTVAVRRLLAEIAMDLGNYDEVTRHGTATIELAPEVLEHQAIGAFIAYREARLSQDNVAAGKVVTEVEALLKEDPELSTALRILTDWHASSPDPMRAIQYLDRLIVLHPESKPIHLARLGILTRAGQTEEAGEKIQELYRLFPEDEQIVDQMAWWYRSQKDFDSLEAFLRERAGPDDADVAGHIAVVELLYQVKGADAATQELSRLAKTNDGSELALNYRLRGETLRFQQGAKDEAITAVRRIIEEAQDMGLKNTARMELSRMEVATGNNDAAIRLVDEVLENDTGNVEGLIARAAWQIRSDDFSAAITNLRRALDQMPRNADTLLLLADAQQKMGNIELAGQRLAQAVEVTNAGAREALVFGKFQIERQNLSAAERVLTDSLRSSGNLEVAQMLGQVLLMQGDFEGVQNVLTLLSDSGNPSAARIAQDLQAALLFNQNRIDEGFAFLRENAKTGDENSQIAAMLKILRVQMISGRLEAARTQLEELLENSPDNIALRLLEGNLYTLEGAPEKAIATYQAIYESNPDSVRVIRRLHSALNSADRSQDANDILARSLSRQPENADLLQMKAIELERSMDGEGAIAIYEDLYAANPTSVVLANNLASMLATHRSDPADIKRAYSIAQRLNGSKNPAQLDTLGWVQLLNGETDTAILNLQAAVRGLPSNPTVAFNLAHAYAQAGRKEDAKAELARGFALAKEDETVPQYSRAVKLREELSG